MSSANVSILEEAYKAAIAARPPKQREWTNLNLPERAKFVSQILYDLYGFCYLEPIFHAHPTATGLSIQFRQVNAGPHAQRESMELEAEKALRFSHLLILHMIDIQNNYFKLGVRDKIQARLGGFQTIWQTEGALRQPTMRPRNPEWSTPSWQYQREIPEQVRTREQGEKAWVTSKRSLS